MANIKELILTKKIDDVLYDLMVKTTANMVFIDETTTLDIRLAAMALDIKNAKDQLATLVGDDAAESITAKIDNAVKTAVDAINNEEDTTSLAGKLKAVASEVTAIQDEATGVLATSKKYTDDKIGLSGTEFATVKAYVDNMQTVLNASIAGAFHFKGTKDYVSELETVESPAAGDVYQIKYVGTEGTVALNAEYAYDGENWVELGSIVDLSAYATTESVTAAINTAKTEILETASQDATTKANAVKTALDEYKTSNDTAVAGKGRFIVGTTVPSDLTENDLFGMIVTTPSEGE